MQKNDLSANHRATLAAYVENFKEFLSTKKGQEWDKEREERHKLFNEKLAKEKIDSMSLEDFSALVNRLWAFAGWSPQGKEWLVNEMLKEGGIENVRIELKKFLYGESSIAEKFDSFNIRQLKGTAAKTELLNIMFPQQYGIWNDRVRRAINFLKLTELLPERVFKPQISGEDYALCNNLLTAIKEQLVSRGLGGISFFHVDLFLYYVFVDFAAETFASVSYLGMNFLIKKVIGEIGNRVEGTVILFGSFARGQPTKRSDIDLFVIGEKKIDMSVIREVGNLVGREISVKSADKRQFLKGLENGDPLIREVVSNHVVLKGVDDFCDIMWRYHAKR